MSLSLSQPADLLPWHTFAVPSQARAGITVSDLSELRAVYRDPKWRDMPKLVLGGGSNVLFTEDFDGLVIRNEILGRHLTRGQSEVLLHLGAGENWDEVVRWTLSQGVFGLENLALIPGTVGAAPIQNIGAYGVEFADHCLYVDYLDLETLEIERLDADQCRFGYRDSVFKQELSGRCVITAVGLALPTDWQPKLGYGPLKALESEGTLTADRIYRAIVDVRQAKLPDPARLGNAGSFFKNPVIEQAEFERLQQCFADLPGYPDPSGGIKVPAGWLIDKAGLKGVAIGGASVHQDQALVLVNRGTATAEDLVALARHVVMTVAERYQITLEPEVRILDGQGALCWQA
ncbi:UDP-N-acetylmuramate dehydrogenase [Ferrimonas pelagia]|uniref:UDP-N-acetylenolpyruvoylglucosamine reductase n=1 Tax=Ferrimonas pelagia TaxID=1177826 RepID=A0ABP9EXS5_9GAMM